MKIHRPIFNAVIQTLKIIFDQGVYADKAVAQALKQNSKWGSRDRKFIAQSVYEIVRWWRLYDTCAINIFKKKNDFIFVFAVWLIDKGNLLPEWDEYKNIDIEKIKAELNKLKKIRVLAESIPDWIDNVALKELGENVWLNELKALNEEAKLVIRANTLKINVSDLTQKLTNHSVEVFSPVIYGDFWEPISNSALVVKKRQPIDKLKEYSDGLFEIQDSGSQLISLFLDVKPGMMVIDACAGAGGKSLHIASLMKNKGSIMAMDLEEQKLKSLNKRAERGGVSIIKTAIVNEAKIKELQGVADRLLLDVPCSGLGVLKRNPDAKWKLTPDFLEQTKKKQEYILYNYSTMLKPGGIMVYATCSILPSENEYQVQHFLKNNSNYKLVKDLTVYPSQGFDGFYMAAIEKVKADN